ncbi:hypothetical protein HK105_200769 [Polyrhizophydium stewartii]|uniref:S-adenosyl-L-methionine-dependent methyltransferase n=1 Tax=Polyrhizophydium stewartii TaxID=2732419 RepID=A0ABR4NJZ4_9FUNG|nr:hypothetical protein HK105_003948 [Polyrhizophydium stewartii]
MPTDWEGIWGKAEGAERPPWDLGGTTPAVAEFLRENPTPLGKSVLVPGCGTGYDVVAFAKAGYEHVVGLDISPTSTKAAREHAADKDAPAAHFETADFFTYSRQVDLLFDYTFACAIDPSIRDAWAAQLANLVRPGGHALVMMYPLRPLDNEGPPFAWSVEQYCHYLEPNFSPVFIKECAGEGRRKGFQLLSLWRRRSPPQPVESDL